MKFSLLLVSSFAWKRYLPRFWENSNNNQGCADSNTKFSQIYKIDRIWNKYPFFFSSRCSVAPMLPVMLWCNVASNKIWSKWHTGISTMSRLNISSMLAACHWYKHYITLPKGTMGITYSLRRYPSQLLHKGAGRLCQKSRPPTWRFVIV